MRQLIIKLFTTLSLVILQVFTAGFASAALITYTSRSDFLAAIAGYNQQTLNFDSMTAGGLIPSGSSAGGITFTYNIPHFTMQIEDTFTTTSSPNYLGLNTNDGAFNHGDSFSMSFSGKIDALGLYVIAGQNIQVSTGDFRLSIGAGYASNSGVVDKSLSDGKAYFIGLLDTGAGFSSAEFLSNGGPYGYEFNIDDITMAKPGSTSVPEPCSLVLLLTCVFGVALSRRIIRVS